MKEKIIGLATAWLGLHVIYFVCIEQGTNNRFNPVWGFLSKMVEVEKDILLISCAFVPSFIIYQVTKNPKKEEYIYYREEPRFIREPIPEREIIAPEFRQQPEPIPQPKPAELTSSELKSKAIRAIVRKHK